jgi:hypothetical protein
MPVTPVPRLPVNQKLRKALLRCSIFRIIYGRGGRSRLEKRMKNVTPRRSGRRPLISVIMANYRGAAFLPAALDSVLAQTIAEIEIIVSDDASPDDSAAVVRQVAARDPRVKLIEARDSALVRYDETRKARTEVQARRDRVQRLIQMLPQMAELDRIRGAPGSLAEIKYAPDNWAVQLPRLQA